MPFSHHSHSGQFCGHATNTLEQMVEKAIAHRMTVFALTEHMPRPAPDLYPDEARSPPAPLRLSISTGTTPATLASLFAAYHLEALRLRSKHASRIQILVGVEIDWIRPSSQRWIEDLLSSYRFDLLVGSVHHVHGVPIDYDAASYARAREEAGGSEERLFEDYFEAQYEMLRALRPPVVGHFDVVRVLSAEGGEGEGSLKRWGRVWEGVERNLRFVVGYGGLVEVNAAGWRKGLGEPYPKGEVCEAFLKLGGRFTLSDDSHGVEQVGLNYEKVLEFVESCGIKELHFLERGGVAFDDRFPGVSVSSASLADLKGHAFWSVDRSIAESAC